MPEKLTREREKIKQEKRREREKSQAQKTLCNKCKNQGDKNMSEGRNTPVDGDPEAEQLSTSDNLSTPITETCSIISGAEIGGPTLSSSEHPLGPTQHYTVFPDQGHHQEVTTCHSPTA